VGGVTGLKKHFAEKEEEKHEVKRKSSTRKKNTK